MVRKRFFVSRKWLAVPPVVIAVAAVAWLVAGREGPRRQAKEEQQRTVRVVQVAPVDVMPRVLAHGVAEAGRTWKAVAEVKGRAVEVHPELKPGAFFQEGDVLLRIDPAEYELAVSRLEAEIAQAKAQLEELSVKEANDRISLSIEEDSLELAQTDLERAERLALQRATSAAEVDQRKRTLLSQRQTVEKLRSSLKLIPQQRKSLDAALAVAEARLQQARLDLAKTVLAAPFDCRIGEVRIEPGQFLAAGQELFVAYDTASAEIEARIPIDRLRLLVRPGHELFDLAGMGKNAVETLFDFDVVVRLRSGDFQAQWEAKVVRMREQFDLRTRTMGLVVAVSDPYKKAIPGKRPPLLEGMYCEVEFRAKPLEDKIVIPRMALKAGHVYIADAENRLRRREVKEAFNQGSFACLESGLEAGERVVVSDTAPAVEGLLLDPVVDDGLWERLLREAAGEGELK